MNAAQKLAALSDKFAVCMLKRPQSSHEGLSLLSLRAIALIHFSEQAPTMNELANHLGVRLPSASVIIDKLEAEGYVERRHDAKDKRIIHVHVTNKSRSFLKKHRDGTLALMNQALDTLGSAEQQTVINFFEHCLAIAEKRQ